MSEPDLHHFLDGGRGFADRDAPPRTRELAESLFEALAPIAAPAAGSGNRRERIVTDALLRSEADRDQNVYLGPLFTRSMTHAVPDLIFLPATMSEAAAALRWARERGVPLTLRGAASTAMGGAVPNDGGLTLDVSRLDEIALDAAGGACVIGAGARLRAVHATLAHHGLALPVYPSNLGGTFAGWFATGGVGMNAFGRGVALDFVKAADVLLPAGDHVRFHADGRLDVSEDDRRRTLAAEESAAWFESRGWRPLTLADFAGSEGVFGLLLHLTVAVEPRPEIGAFLLGFRSRVDAFAAAAWIGASAGSALPRPANLKLISKTHLQHVRKVWADEDSRQWRRQPSHLTDGATMPWSRIDAPSAAVDSHQPGAYLFVDFLRVEDARAFGAALGGIPGGPVALGETARFAADRFKPQMTKRLGPGLVAAEVVIPAEEVPRYLPRAEAMARNVGVQLDAEVYYMKGGEALVIAATLTDHRCAEFLVDLTLAPALTDLAMTNHRGRPYVLGRWQSAWFERKFGADGARHRAAIKLALDPAAIVNRGVLTGLRLRGALGAAMAATFRPGIGVLRIVYGTAALAWTARLARKVLSRFPGPAWGRGEPAAIGARFGTHEEQAARPTAAPPSHEQAAAARSLNCVNCGECNSVCPIFHESGIRLPQMLTHTGEAVFAEAPLPKTAAALLDLCMRCGNCEEVCQAGIPHLPLYEAMQNASNADHGYDRERHSAILTAVRGSERYLREFLGVRRGGYQKRTPASLTGSPRYLLLRAEGDAGPAATCIHCGACVAVCPTLANHELQGSDPRWITTLQDRCIGCGTCVEVCPANAQNGGQTLRVMEAPTAAWFVALEELEQQKP